MNIDILQQRAKQFAIKRLNLWRYKMLISNTRKSGLRGTHKMRLSYENKAHGTHHNIFNHYLHILFLWLHRAEKNGTSD